MTHGGPSQASPGVGPGLAVVFAVIGFFALAIFGLGMVNLATGDEVIAVPGLGQTPGVVGMGLSTAAVALSLWLVVRRPAPSFAGAFIVAVAAALGYVVGVWLGAVFTGVDLAPATAAAGGFLFSWFGLVLTVAGLLAGIAGVALVRTRSGRPQWPWEKHADDE